MGLGEAALLFLLFGLPVLIGAGAWLAVARREARQLASDAPPPVPPPTLEESTYRSAFDWRGLAAELGLEYVEPGGSAGGRLIVGGREGLGVTISELAYATRQNCDASCGLAVEVDGRGLIPHTVSLRAEGGLDALRKVVSGEDVLVGDSAFDQQAHVQGPEDAVLAALREPARRAILPLLTGHRATVTDGVLRVELNGVVEHQSLKRLVQGMAQAARSMCVQSVPDSLADGARDDSNPEVRLKSLQVLLRVWREHAAARRAAHSAIADANPRARLAAARLIADEPAALALRKLADDASVPPDVRLGALETLLELRPDFLAEALRSWIGDEQLAAAAAHAFGSLGDSLAEPLLVGLLGHPWPSARAAAVEALGQVGTVRAVEPLSALAAGGPLQAAARDAIRRIQSRLGDVAAGRLSVSPGQGPSGGGLSLPVTAVADDVAGEPAGLDSPPERLKG